MNGLGSEFFEEGSYEGALIKTNFENTTFFSTLAKFVGALCYLDNLHDEMEFLKNTWNRYGDQ
jgi:hypothetical protein